MADDITSLPQAASPRASATGWEPGLAELRRRQALARELGGTDRVARQHESGRLTVRERVDRMLDPDSFQEVGGIADKASHDAHGAITGFIPAKCVLGRGAPSMAALWSSPVMIYAPRRVRRCRHQGQAQDVGGNRHPIPMPVIRLIEGSGGGGSVKTIETTGRANLPAG